MKNGVLGITLLCLAHMVNSQMTHFVQVGVADNSYNPTSLNAEVGDTVTFVFAGSNHTVTQTSFDNPCTTLPQGFSSGILGTNQNSTSSPTWSFLVTNSSEPIWYSCQLPGSKSYCASGMVGVINPPNAESVLEFISAAKGTPETSTTSTSPQPTGPVATVTVTDNAPTATSPSELNSPTAVGSSDHTGAVVGLVLGALGLGLAIGAIFWLRRRRRNRTPPSALISPLAIPYNFHSQHINATWRTSHSASVVQHIPSTIYGSTCTSSTTLSEPAVPHNSGIPPMFQGNNSSSGPIPQTECSSSDRPPSFASLINPFDVGVIQMPVPDYSNVEGQANHIVPVGEIDQYVSTAHVVNQHDDEPGAVDAGGSDGPPPRYRSGIAPPVAPRRKR